MRQQVNRCLGVRKSTRQTRVESVIKQTEFVQSTCVNRCVRGDRTNSSQRNVVDRTPTEAIDTPETAAMFANGVDEPGRAGSRLWHRRCHRRRSTASQRGFHCRNPLRTLLSGAVVTNLACLWSPCRCEEALIVITRLWLRGESTLAVHLRSDPGENPATPVGRSR
jgi:hypothetical protein